jgi:hypothetical protein
MIARVFVVIALLACSSNAASLQPSATRQNWQDLEVITLDPQGNPAETVYYSYNQLLTLPAVTVKTDRDPNTSATAISTLPPLAGIGAGAYLWAEVISRSVRAIR